MSYRIYFVTQRYRPQGWEDEVMTPGRYLAPLMTRMMGMAPVKVYWQRSQAGRAEQWQARYTQCMGAERIFDAQELPTPRRRVGARRRGACQHG